MTMDQEKNKIVQNSTTQPIEPKTDIVEEELNLSPEELRLKRKRKKNSEKRRLKRLKMRQIKREEKERKLQSILKLKNNLIESRSRWNGVKLLSRIAIRNFSLFQIQDLEKKR